MPVKRSIVIAATRSIVRDVLGKSGRGVSASDPDVAAWLTAVLATGATVTQPVVNAYDTFVIGLKADAVWSTILDMGVWLGPTTLAGALVKLKDTNPVSIVNVNFVSGDYSPNGGLTAANGKTLTIAKSPVSLGWTQTSATLGMYLMANNTATQVFIGTSSTTTRCRLAGTNTGFIQGFLNTSAVTGRSYEGQQDTNRGMILATRVDSNPGNMTFRSYGSSTMYGEETVACGPGNPTSTGSGIGLTALPNGTSSIGIPAAGYIMGLGLGASERIAMTSRWGTLVDTLIAL